VYLGLNHSDSTLLMRLPKEKIVFAVDFVSVGSVPGRGMIDSYPVEWEESLKKGIAMVRPAPLLRPVGPRHLSRG